MEFVKSVAHQSNGGQNMDIVSKCINESVEMSCEKFLAKF